MDEALFARLTTYPSLAALVGDRVFPVTRPSSAATPALVYTRVSNPRVSSIAGESGLARPRYQVTAWADTHDQAKAVIAEVHRAIAQDFVGVFAGVDVRGGRHVDTDRDVYDDDAGVYGVQQDFTIWHREG